MKQPIVRALVITALHLAILGTLGGKLLYDRATRPRVWLRTAYFDPSLPIRGRYVALQSDVEFHSTRISPQPPNSGLVYSKARLEVQNGKLVAISDVNGSVDLLERSEENRQTAVLAEPMLVFLPENFDPPAIRSQGKELWVEATIPRKGPPRPIRLGVKENGVITPVDVH